MKLFQVKFRIDPDRLGEVMERLSDVGPVVVEHVVDDEPPTIRKDIVNFGQILADMKKAHEAEPSNLKWTENTVDHSKVIPRRPYGLGKQTLLDRLKDGPVPYHALMDTYMNAGLKKTGLGSALGTMLVAGLIERGEPGFWKLKGN